MKTSIISTVILLACIFTISAQEINPIRMGQFFEQGYGRGADDWSNEESALDIIATPTGIAMAGWMSSESHGLRMSLWHVNEYGALSLFGEYGNDQTHQIAASLALSSTGQSLLVGRQTDTYSDEYRSTLNAGDLALIKYIDTDGGELWSVLLDSTDTDTSEIAVDVFNSGSNEFVILINRLYSETNIQDFRVIKIESNSNVLWDKKYSLTYSGSKQNIFAEKIIDRGNGYYLVQANDVYNKHVLICEINANDGSYQTHQNYPQTNPTLGFGVSQNLSTGGYIVVGSEENGPELDGFILEINPDLSEYGSHTIVNNSSGNEHFKDIITHPTGYLAIGECDNRGEGNRDVWICHLDSLTDTLKVETLGGEETDYGHAVALVPSVFSAFIAGYNNSYTIEESGNAYLGGVKVDIGLPENNSECKVPRVLWVEDFVKRPDMVEALILGDVSEENNLIQFAIDNQITHFALFNLGLIFDTVADHHTYILNSKKLFRHKLDTFITNCRANGIYCGMVTDTTLHSMVNSAGYNKDTFDYRHSGKLTFEVLEHEFWNAHNLPKNSGPPPHNPPTGGAAMNTHFEYVWLDHKNAIATLNQFKKNNANFWQVYDYLGHLYHRWDVDTTQNYYWHSNDTSQSQKADYLEKNLDGLFLHYYTRNNYNNGLDFLNDGMYLDMQNDCPTLVSRTTPPLSFLYFLQNIITQVQTFVGKVQLHMTI